MDREEIRNNKHQLLGQLFSDLMHEIRNPLSVLKLNLDLLKTLEKEQFENANEELPEILETWEEAIKIIEQLITRTLEFVRDPEDDFGHCSVNAIAKIVYGFTKTHAKKKGVKLKLELSESDALIEANKGQIVQVLLNLISNSFDAVDKNPEILISTIVDENSALFEVTDNGNGIEKNKIDKIFKKYFTTKKNGAGIGLAVSKEILDAHGANISVSSEVGKGTTFRIKFNNARKENR